MTQGCGFVHSINMFKLLVYFSTKRSKAVVLVVSMVVCIRGERPQSVFSYRMVWYSLGKLAIFYKLQRKCFFFLFFFHFCTGQTFKYDISKVGKI